MDNIINNVCVVLLLCLSILSILQLKNKNILKTFNLYHIKKHDKQNCSRKPIFTHLKCYNKNNESDYIKTSVFFLHIHKSGGTTMNNVIRNFALNHDLKFALFYNNPWPDNEFSHYIVNKNCTNSVNELDTNLTTMYTNDKFDVLYNHIIYNKTEIVKNLKTHGTKPKELYITMLREPLSLLKSLFNFMQLQKFFNLTGTGGMLLFYTFL